MTKYKIKPVLIPYYRSFNYYNNSDLKDIDSLIYSLNPLLQVIQLLLEGQETGNLYVITDRLNPLLQVIQLLH